MKREESIGMGCKRARNICIVKTLAKLGHFPTRTTGKEAWFLSPLRSETQASFKVSLKLNRWYDHGLGKGGNILDLIIAINQYTVREALDFLEGSDPSFSFHQPITGKDKASKIEVNKTQPIQHPGLVQYLDTRGIPLEIAKVYCREVWYRFKGKSYFAIGLENHIGGWELRNPYCKNCSSPKSYTYHENSKVHLVILEGMFDLLSLAVLEPKLVKNSAILILNSLAFMDRIKPLLSNYIKIQLYMDNDAAGKKATNELLTCFSQAIDYSGSYSQYKDLNEKLKDHGREKK